MVVHHISPPPTWGSMTPDLPRVPGCTLGVLPLHLGLLLGSLWVNNSNMSANWGYISPEKSSSLEEPSALKKPGPEVLQQWALHAGSRGCSLTAPGRPRPVKTAQLLKPQSLLFWGCCGGAAWDTSSSQCSWEAKRTRIPYKEHSGAHHVTPT